MPPRTVLVTGANGYIGNAVARAFSRAGWLTYGLTRRHKYSSVLSAEEISPIIIDSYSDTQTVLAALPERIDAIVSTTEQISDYHAHYTQVVELLREVAVRSQQAGLKSLLIFTSGCKDYGFTHGLDGDPSLSPHTEESPLNPPSILKPRTESALSLFGEPFDQIFDTVVTRPTTMYGLSGSYYALLFAHAEKALTEPDKVLDIPANPRSIMHGLHGDDCAEAYVAIANAPRDVVKGQIYNISGRSYETARQVVEGIVALYGLDGVRFKEDAAPDIGYQAMDSGSGNAFTSLTGFSQWVCSEKIRRDCGWTDRKALFTEAIRQYHLAYDALKR